MQLPVPNELTCPSPSWALPGGWSVRGIGILLVSTWLIAFGMALVSMNLRAVWNSLCNRLHGVANGIRCFGAGVQADTMDVAKAALFLLCEVLLVASRRVLVGKTALRKTALRLRPYTSAAVQDIDSDAVLTPQRRSLRAIQMLQSGGARKMRTTRLACIRRRGLRVLFNPVGKGDCFLRPSPFMWPRSSRSGDCPAKLFEPWSRNMPSFYFARRNRWRMDFPFTTCCASSAWKRMSLSKDSLSVGHAGATRLTSWWQLTSGKSVCK
eukprot:490116-Amphidinium_carterae.3